MRISRARGQAYEAQEGVAAALDIALLAEPWAVADLRRTVRCHLVRNGREAYADTAQLCVSELITNVINHVGVGAPVTLRVTFPYGRLRIELTDPAPDILPTRLNPTGDQESGRGLALLDLFAESWGVVQGADSKTTWCELRAGPVPVQREEDRSLLP